MGQVNLGNLLIGIGYGANISESSQNALNFTSNASFDKVLNRAKNTSQTYDRLSSTKSVEQKDDSRHKEESYDNKTVIDNEKGRNHTQITQKTDAISKETNKEVQEEEELENQGIEEQILILVGQSLNVSIDEIKETLNRLGLEIKDLMSQEGFSHFIGEICGQGSVAELLMNTNNLKSITALFEKLSTFKDQIQIVSSQNTMQHALMTSLQEQGLTERSIENKSNSISMLQASETDQSTLNEEITISTIKTIEHYGEDTETSDQDLSFLQEQEKQTEEIGINVPVQHFTTTTFTQRFEAEVGTVTQMTTTKSIEHGEVLIKQVDFKVLAQTRELNVQLSPKELGDLNIRITENNGVLVAEIKVDNDKAKEFILNELHLLKENLQEQGLNVSDVKVDIRQDHHQSQMEQERQKSSKRIQEIISKHFAEVEEEKEVAPMIGESEIDYMV